MCLQLQGLFWPSSGDFWINSLHKGKSRLMTEPRWLCVSLHSPVSNFEWADRFSPNFLWTSKYWRSAQHRTFYLPTISSRSIFFSISPTAPSRPRSPYYPGFKTTLRHTTLGRTNPDEWSARRRDLNLTTHNTHKRHACLGGIRTPNPSKRAAVDPRLRPRGHWELQHNGHVKLWGGRLTSATKFIILNVTYGNGYWERVTILLR